jgi:hypothetical protein
MAVVLHATALRQEHLLRLGPAERNWFVLAGHICNELAALQRHLVQCMNYAPTSEPGRHGFTVQNWIVAKVLAGKIHEAHQAMGRYYFPTLSREYFPLLPADAQQAQREVNRYFGHDNPISRVRNSAAFHYAADNAAATIDALPPEKRLAFYVAEQEGNSLYHYAEELLFAELFPHDDVEAVRAAFDTLIGDITRIARATTAFLAGCLSVATIKMMPGTILERVVVPEGDTGFIDSARIPYFLDPAAHVRER